MDKDIIRIAEAMGYQQVFKGAWINPGATEDHYEYTYLPNPKTSHADCHALIEWLNGRGWAVETMWRVRAEDIVVMRGTERTSYFRWSGTDYRLGVVDLTLKILESDDD